MYTQICKCNSRENDVIFFFSLNESKTRENKKEHNQYHERLKINIITLKIKSKI